MDKKKKTSPIVAIIVPNEALDRNYKLKINGLTTAMEQIKQNILSKSQKIKGFLKRNKQFEENRLLQISSTVH